MTSHRLQFRHDFNSDLSSFLTFPVGNTHTLGELLFFASAVDMTVEGERANRKSVHVQWTRRIAAAAAATIASQTPKYIVCCLPILHPWNKVCMGGKEKHKGIPKNEGSCSQFSSSLNASHPPVLLMTLIYFSEDLIILFSHFPTLNVMYVCKLLIVLSNNTCSLGVPVLVLYNCILMGIRNFLTVWSPPTLLCLMLTNEEVLNRGFDYFIINI